MRRSSQANSAGARRRRSRPDWRRRSAGISSGATGGRRCATASIAASGSACSGSSAAMKIFVAGSAGPARARARRSRDGSRTSRCSRSAVRTLDLERRAGRRIASQHSRPMRSSMRRPTPRSTRRKATPRAPSPINRDGAAWLAGIAAQAEDSVPACLDRLRLRRRQERRLHRRRCDQPADRLRPDQARRRGGGAGDVSRGADFSHGLGLQPVRHRISSRPCCGSRASATACAWWTIRSEIRRLRMIWPRLCSTSQSAPCSRDDRPRGIYHLAANRRVDMVRLCAGDHAPGRRARPSCGPGRADRHRRLSDAGRSARPIRGSIATDCIAISDCACLAGRTALRQQ